MLAWVVFQTEENADSVIRIRGGHRKIETEIGRVFIVKMTFQSEEAPETLQWIASALTLALSSSSVSAAREGFSTNENKQNKRSLV